MHQIKTIAFFILFVILSLYSCRLKNKSLIDEMTFRDEIIHPSDSAALLNLTSDISNLEFVANGPIGFSGKEIHQLHYGHILAVTADTNQLLKLTSHKSPYVRKFAFEALKENQFNGLKKVFEDHLADQQTYKEFGGCIQQSVCINVCYFRIIFSTLNKSEADFYRNVILKQNKSTRNIFAPSGI